MSLIKSPFFRYTVIDELLGRKKWVKTVDIKRIIEEQLAEEVSIRTIQNDLRDLRDDTRLGYNAPIEYDNKNKAYRYTDPEYSIKNFGLKHSEIAAFKFYAQCLSMFRNYSLFSDFSAGLNKIVHGVSIRNRVTQNINPQMIIQADTLNVAKGNEHLGEAVYAIDNHFKIELTYQSFENKTPNKRIVYPYFIQEYRHRWYLLAVSPKETKIKTFAFDRIKKLTAIEEKFNRNIDFEAEEYFKYSFGITTPNEKVEQIVLRFNTTEAPYIKSLPIHPSQEIVNESAKHLDITIRVRISYELKEFILSKTPTITVLSPEHLVIEICNLLSEGQKNYSKKIASRK